MPFREAAEGFFGKLNPRNLANEAVTGYIRPGATFWEKTARGGLTEIYVNPDDVIILLLGAV